MARSVRPARSGLVFLLTFLCTLLLVGGVGIWMITDFHKTPSADEPADNAPPAPPTARAAHHLLLITEDGGEAQGFVLLSFETAMGRIQATAIPRETNLIHGTTQSRLFKLYHTLDTQTLTQKIGADLFSKTVSHYAIMSYDNIEAFVTHLNQGVIYTLTENITYKTQSGSTITMKSGTSTLSAMQVTDILRYTAWHGGRRAMANAQGDIVAAMFNQYFVPARFDDRDTDFNKFISLSRSNILTSDFLAVRKDLLTLARRNNFNICRTVSPKGEFIGVGDAMRFEMDKEQSEA